MNVLIDSSGWISYFGEEKTAERFSQYINKANKESFVTPTVVLYEVYKRIKKTKGEEVAVSASAYILGHTSIMDLNERLSIDAADISLKHNLGMADAIIKATADEKNAKIVTSDSDLKDFENVIFISK